MKIKARDVKAGDTIHMDFNDVLIEDVNIERLRSGDEVAVFRHKSTA